MASFGETLRRERELRQVSLRDMADSTKISMRFLQALEQDRIDVLPGGVFRRSFVRQYARYLGLDADRLVAEFVYAHAQEEGGEKESAPSPREGLSQGLLLLAGLIVIVGFVWLVKAGPGRVSRDTPPAPAPVVGPPVDRVYPPPSPERQVDAAAPEGLVLTLSAHQSCWVEAKADGQMILNRVLTEGQNETIEAHGQIVLSVGNAGGLTFRVNDRTGVSLGRLGEVRRNIVITRESLPSFVEDGAPPLRASRSS